MYHPFHPKDIGWKFESNIIFQIGASNTEIRYIETQLVGKPIQFRTLQYNNFSLQELFPLKKNWIQLQVKKKIKKQNKTKQKNSPHGKYYCHVDKFGSNDDLDTFIWWYKWYIYSVQWRCHVLKTEKILIFHPQPYYRYYYYISRVLRYQKKRRDCLFFCNLELCFKIRLFSRDICWFWYWREL